LLVSFVLLIALRHKAALEEYSVDIQIPVGYIKNTGLCI